MGFLGYELRHFVERGTSFAKRDLGLPDLFFAFFDLVVAYDHLDDRTYLLSTGLPYKGAERVQYARRRMDQLLTWIDESGKAGPPLSEHSLSVRDRSPSWLKGSRSCPNRSMSGWSSGPRPTSHRAMSTRSISPNAFRLPSCADPAISSIPESDQSCPIWSVPARSTVERHQRLA